VIILGTISVIFWFPDEPSPGAENAVIFLGAGRISELLFAPLKVDHRRAFFGGPVTPRRPYLGAENAIILAGTGVPGAPDPSLWG